MNLVTTKDKINLTVHNQTYFAELKLDVRFEYYTYHETPPLNINGVLVLDNKDLAYMHELTRSRSNYGNVSLSPDIENLPRHEIDEKNKHKTEWIIDLYTPLNEKALSIIEKHREKNDGEVNFDFLFFITYFYRDSINDKNLKFGQKTEMLRSHRIAQSDWVKSFAKQLGIGNFILVEFPEYQLVEITDDFFKPLGIGLEGFMNTLDKMKSLLLKGEWRQVVAEGRKFIEYIYKPEEAVKESLKELFMESGKMIPKHFNDFYELVKNIHSITSASVHIKDIQKNYINPDYHREDAYFIYSMCVSLANSIMCKLERKQQK